MIRRIIQIDKSKCNGCGLCVKACHEGAIKLIDGKAKLTRDDYCDGFGDCLPSCPMNAISFIMKDTLEYNEEAVLKAKQENSSCSCLSYKPKSISRENTSPCYISSSLLNNWPVQLKLAPSKADYYNDANLLVAADCTAFTYGNFHNDFINDHITLIGCPKLDRTDYTDKLTEILLFNKINSITIVRMEVPCYSGLELYVKDAMKYSNKNIPIKTLIISTQGDILSNE